MVGDAGLVGRARSTAAADVEERVTELLRRPVVDDGVDARVEVRQTVPQHAHRLTHVIRHNRAVSCDGDAEIAGVEIAAPEYKGKNRGRRKNVWKAKVLKMYSDYID